ncbi:putative glutathione S-transferase [Geothermobacter ehrlichii]|uniref:Putative glutathione S-transferase n=1 Tax=Geothermobacter ehrlichii TaxID=213224 RepID=A0A5D3WPJ6_9BACT|nr:glutathione S-transferase family protein [Geothermobacter ehrlichii]TYO99328.1 putative glutathione S-transferase [Geothermobacter ehrlichii]
MGLLIDGVWHDRWYDTEKSGGRFERQPSRFRDRITADGSSGFPAEAGRYHLIVSLACPWAHRTLIIRRLKKLEEVISLAVVDPIMGDEGWVFAGEGEPVTGVRRLYELYTLACPDYSGRVTVPLLWDRKTGTIVNNESSEIIRFFNREFDAFGERSVDFCPPELLAVIDRINAFVYERINNGVYRCGFATTQQAYEEACRQLFAALDQIEELLSRQRYLVGNRLTEADWRLFTTLVRFDAVYYGHFKCNLRRIADYPHLFGYLRELYQWPGVADTVDFAHIKQHYYRSHRQINPTGIVPLGPVLDLTAPHGRDRLG